MSTPEAFTYIAVYVCGLALAAIAAGGFLFPSFRKDRK